MSGVNKAVARGLLAISILPSAAGVT